MRRTHRAALLGLAFGAVLAATVSLVAAPRGAEAVPGTPDRTVVADEAGCAAKVERLSLRDHVSQLFMVGVTDTGSVLAVARDWQPGSVILTGRRQDGRAAIRSLTDRVTAALRTPEAAPLVAVDQEGGAVQALRGDGFSDIPSASVQGQLPTDQLEESAARWAQELSAAGVTMNLAPVADVLAAQLGDRNEAIGRTGRSFSTDSAEVAGHVDAFVAGMNTAHVVPVLKHFPGLGAVAGNPDYRDQVIDRRLDATSAELDAYRSTLARRPAAVMMSTAVYEKLDPTNPAAFSAEVVTGLLRGQLGFDGVVVSDDLGRAVQVRSVPVADRAVRFVRAGGDLVISVDAAAAAAMRDGLISRAAADPELTSSIRRSAGRIFALKASMGLLTCGARPAG